MTAKVLTCKHPRLGKEKQCKDCGVIIDIRPKRSKYGARRTNGFASAKESRRYEELKVDPHVIGLQTQFQYPLTVNGCTVGFYIADFVYWRYGQLIVEDVKGVRTPVYRLKKKLMQACLGIEIKEI